MFIYGKNSVTEYLKKDKKVYKALVLEHFNDEFIFSELEKKDISIKVVSKNDISEFEKYNHQGIILDIPDFEYIDYVELMDNITDVPFLIMLDHLEDVHNLGAIIRTCEAAGVDGIIIPKNRSVNVNSTVMKISSGALANMDICMVTNLNNIIRDLKDRGILVVGTDMDGENYTEIDMKGPVCLVIGSEGNGMSRLVKENCDVIASLPMKGDINSLNASVAAGITIYEILRQRG